MAVTEPFLDVARMAAKLSAKLAVELLATAMASDSMPMMHFFRMNPPPLHTAGDRAKFFLSVSRILYERLAALLANIFAIVVVFNVWARLLVAPSAKGFYGVHGKGEHLGNFPVPYSFVPIADDFVFLFLRHACLLDR